MELPYCLSLKRIGGLEMDEYNKNKLHQNIIIAIIGGLLLAIAYFNKGKVTNRSFFTKYC